MVTIRSVGRTSPTRIEHERITSPLTCTLQAPHCATPHPYLVPVSPSCSRMTHRSGVSPATCTSRFWPLMFNLAIRTLPRVAHRRRIVVDCFEPTHGLRPHARGAGCPSRQLSSVLIYQRHGGLPTRATP